MRHRQVPSRSAIKALKIFQGYAKKKQTFDMVASEFNNKNIYV